MPKVNQLTVHCENRPGTLAQIATLMGQLKVNIFDFLLTTSGTKGHVKLIVDDVKKAKQGLEVAGLLYSEQIVLRQNSRLRLEPLGALLERSPREGSTSLRAIKRSRRAQRSKCSAGGLSPRQGTPRLPEHRFGSFV